MYEFMKPVKVRSLCVGGLIDENGRFLRVIGNLPIKEGETVWTDGNIAYGHIPIKPTVKPFIPPLDGIPVLSKNLNGYIKMNSQYVGRNWRIKNEYENFLLNNKNEIFEYLNSKMYNYFTLDAELDENNQNEYFYAARRTKDTRNVYYDATLKTDYVGFGQKGNEVFIDIYKIKKIDGGEYASSIIKTIRPTELCRPFVNEILKYCVVCYADYFVVQVLDFRFIDKKGNYEIIAACFLKGGGNVKGVADAQVGRLETEYTSDAQYLGKSEFIGDTEMHSWRITHTANTKYVSSGGGSYTSSGLASVKFNNIYLVARISSDGTSEILNKKIKQPAGVKRYLSGFHIRSWTANPAGGAWVFAPSFPLNGYPTGSFTYVLNAVYKKGESVNTSNPPELVGAAGTYNLVSWDVTCQEIELEYDDFEIQEVNEEVMKPFKIKLNEGYEADCDCFNLYNIRKQGSDYVKIADEIQSTNISYRIEPSLTNDNYKVRTMYNGKFEEGASNLIPSYYCVQDKAEIDEESQKDPPQYHMIPHACIEELKNGFVLSARGDKYHKGGLYLANQKGLQKLDKKSANIRLNKVNRIKRLKK